jgi:hypothetical protein
MAAGVPVLVMPVVVGVLMAMSFGLVAVLMPVMGMGFRLVRVLMLMLVLVVATHQAPLLSSLFLLNLTGCPVSCQGLVFEFSWNDRDQVWMEERHKRETVNLLPQRAQS